MSDIALIETARDFNRFYTNFLGLLNKAYLDSPFTLTDARVLFEIGSHHGISAVSLFRDLHLDPAYLSRILKRFRAEGLIETSPDPADLRSKVIIVTDQGREKFEELGRRANAQIAARFDDLAAGEPEAAVRAMGTIRALLDPAAKPAPAIIRAHRAGDIGWIVQSQGRFYAEEYGWDLRFEALVAEVAGKFLANFDPALEYCWIAERRGVNIGSVLITNGGDGIAKLRLLYVDKSARGLGLGKLLVGECIRFCRQKGYSEIQLWTNDMLETARAIYVKTGFRLVSEGRHRMFGPEANGQNWALTL
ncbi:DNA-binding MarR family transcriptional regulator/GNAT superfamily N-acetyltransferase [Rhizobium leguminosarum]|uniref:DNA-binding MarR family transcriptional regulator/GNAT superfamily N-acetyltransferase n=1 Tax=Rhizobium leguminosarum TaxID=384 RepID=A0AAE2MI60_RHILE|nr:MULTISPECIES: MarR family winged helix-turn-helix transcriptional regulator [Rhizobium]MBB4289627.1 DNA-binding MarR family transcriptional regulator/GNAT superfamily N-acetyltransferase [Rhizobium leguminosarum]MBB4296271.1 DNA-binding MarR family transcriptional regulator/GNAT superfamily N-acetyltransferase [Rhizobium leguminosarum]MBB4308469.1 DNA-binding MarR family transcriptional regulator/GNAT superfamily N-acetyltransferase [Rhizobium leguminosarum]MBB4416305.1 DNA-binding MarR fami